MHPSPRSALSAALLLAAVALQGCGEDGLAGTLRQSGIATTPDEFMVLPTRPLEMPPDIAALPPPTPGAVNRVEYRPQAEAIAALTGAPAAATAPGATLVARVGPAAADIRATLAREDAEYRRGNRPRLLERWFSRDQDGIVYSGMRLDSDAELRRLRAQGVRVPAAPPPAE